MIAWWPSNCQPHGSRADGVPITVQDIADEIGGAEEQGSGSPLEVAQEVYAALPAAGLGNLQPRQAHDLGDEAAARRLNAEVAGVKGHSVCAQWKVRRRKDSPGPAPLGHACKDPRQLRA